MKRFLLLPLVAVSAFFFVSCASARQDGMSEKAMFVLVYDGSNTGLGNVKVYATKDGESERKFLGTSDMHGRFFMVLEEKANYMLMLEKDGYESASKSFEFQGMTGLYFRMLTVDDLLSESEKALDLRNYSKALAYCNRAFALDDTRKDTAFLQKIILNKIEKNGAKSE